jgi:sulfur relay (sulfurtransferase) DsrF/TusC family protein
MDIQTNIILTEDAVFTALKQQDPTAIKAASLHEALANAREFGARTYVHVESLAQRGIGKQELIDIESIDTAGLAGMIEQAEATLTF